MFQMQFRLINQPEIRLNTINPILPAVVDFTVFHLSKNHCV